MDALNSATVTKKYLVFLSYFSLLLCVTMICFKFYFITCESYLDSINVALEETNEVRLQQDQITSKIDTLNTYLKLLNTGQVQNEIALERKIIKLKNDAIKGLSTIEDLGANFKLYKTFIYNIEPALQYKKNFQLAKSEEESLRKKLLECITANKKAKMDFEN